MNFFSKLSIISRLSIVLVFISCGPLAYILVLLDLKKYDEALVSTAVMLALFLMTLVPVSYFIGYVVFVKDVKAINKICLNLRAGQYDKGFILPPEAEDEHIMMKLKRNINWTIYEVYSRERKLQDRIEDVRTANKSIKQESDKDALTGVYSRGFFEKKFASILAQASTPWSETKTVGLVLVDCDDFKNINDSFGHVAGDLVLSQLGKVLSTSIRAEGDWAFRYGGDEFGVVFKDATDVEIYSISERIRKNFEESNTYKATISMGIVNLRCSPANKKSANAMKESADSSLYIAKSKGKNKINMCKLGD